jgi:hypothetical protein
MTEDEKELGRLLREIVNKIADRELLNQMNYSFIKLDELPECLKRNHTDSKDKED